MSNLTGLQKTQMDILRKFSEVAKRENIKWFVMFGTLLGAVREKGFIPWDDDIDIAIPKADYDRLMSSGGWFCEPYFLQTPYSDPAAAPRYIRLRRSDTAVLAAGFPNSFTRGGNMGAYIDILPLVDVKDGMQAKELWHAASQVNRQMFASAALDECEGTQTPDWKELICFKDGGIAGHYKYFADRYEKIFSYKLPGCEAGKPYYAVPAMRDERAYRVFDKKWFEGSVDMEFEGLTVPAPIGWNETLIASFPYGTYAPDEKYRKAKHTDGGVVDMTRSYREYLQRYTDMLCGIEGKKVCIFGAGDSFRIWLERYSKGVDVVCAFDNSPNKWGSKAYGVMVRPPSELTRLIDEADTRLIIASIYYKEISEQLEDMGVTDCYIFIDGWNYFKAG